MTVAVAEAPGKVIITGEHFVVHGAVALVAAIELTTRVEARRNSRGLILERPTSNASHGPYKENRPVSPVERLVREMYNERSRAPNVTLRITSDIPTGSGLGSSASAMVATAAAVSHLEGWEDHPTSLIEKAMVGERLVHGRPSGVDVAVSALGGVLQFKMGEGARPIELRAPVKIVVAYSGERRSTSRLIHKVSSMKTVYPHLFAGLCEASSAITRRATESLVDGDLRALGTLMTYTHAVLGMVGASNPRLDGLVDLCLDQGCIGAKLTGAGGGGSVIAVTDAGKESEVAAALSRRGFRSFVCGLPRGGVKVRLKDE